MVCRMTVYLLFDMSQKIEYIAVKDLVLWTENPRDPIDASASDQDVVDRAMSDPSSKWELSKFAKQMGEYYDYSELPIVVYKNNKPVVYDGNRRIVLAKIKLGFCHVDGLTVALPTFDETIPCNVCDEDTALKSVYRKHYLVGNTWGKLERDVFANKYLNEPKSTFQLFDEGTGGFVTKNPEMNQRFVCEEVLTDTVLYEMGFVFEDERLFTRHTNDEVKVLLSDLLNKIRNKEISTRKNRGKPISTLDQRSKDIIWSNKDRELHLYETERGNDTEIKETTARPSSARKTPVTRKTRISLFGDSLFLKSGSVNNLYRDLSALYSLVEGEKSFSKDVYALFRMGLRLLCETACKEEGFVDIKDYLMKYFSKAKKTLSQDIKTYLSTNNVKEETMPQLLHIGAHNYLSSVSKDQLIAVSIMLGAILTQSHGK